MRILLIVFASLVFSSCATNRPQEPDVDKITSGLEYLKRNVPNEITLPKIDLPSLKECGEFLCLSNIDWKRLEFEILKVREKMFYRHEADKSITRSYNELIDNIAKEKVAYAYSIYRNQILTNEVNGLRFKSGLQKWGERVLFLITFVVGATTLK